ncbi:MAG TPA: FAD-binding oxidoreductase [Solirubrobacteraceae bacterium]|jgi:FAD/FMN-containing dehydrogenase|nr:FAD-binding oxidoreductase [Solirubrobacteraceae bacterium]
MLADDGVVQDLEGVFAGELLTPGDTRYETARRVWNGMVDRRPALIARCVDDHDVVRALAAARERGLPVAVRGGGHNVAGNAVCEGGVVIDLSAQKAISVDPHRRTARVQPGVLLGELDRATQAHGLATPTGNVSMTGVAGLTLGGGLGWIARKHGPTCDNLLSADVVTVGGERVRAGADENADLLWGLRGGGGNFGVVTSFEYRLHQVGPQVLAGGVVHSFADASGLFRFLGEFVAEAPDELSITASTFRASPQMPVPPEMHGELVTVLAVCFAGDVAAGEEALRPLRGFGRPLLDAIAPMPYTALQSGSDASYPNGQHNYWKSHYIDELSDDVIATIIEHAPRMSSPLSSFYLQHLGGAIARGDGASAAFGHRDALFDFAILTVWQDPAETADHVTWARDFFDGMQPHASGVYVNNLGAEGAERVKAAYAPRTYDRLVALKETYDPHNVLRVNQNIAPRAS